MKGAVFLTSIGFFMLFTAMSADRLFESDTYPTSEGDLVITFIGHGSLMLTLGDKVIHVDPWSRLADYTRMPDADLILITHEHRDHLDNKAINEVRKDDTLILANMEAALSVDKAEGIRNGQKRTIVDLSIEAFPAYNLVHKRPDERPYHPKGKGNGYIIGFAGKRIYIAGDTENIPEMNDIGPIDIAFIPVNLPYTMSLEMAVDAARMIHPKILYPYHYGETDIGRLTGMLRNEPDIEVRIRPMK